MCQHKKAIIFAFLCFFSRANLESKLYFGFEALEALNLGLAKDVFETSWAAVFLTARKRVEANAKALAFEEAVGELDYGEEAA